LNNAHTHPVQRIQRDVEQADACLHCLAWDAHGEGGTYPPAEKSTLPPGFQGVFGFLPGYRLRVAG
jgi:hypothetical protein